MKWRARRVNRKRDVSCAMPHKKSPHCRDGDSSRQTPAPSARDATLFPERVILHGRTIEQTIDRQQRAAFFKELVVTGGKVPLAMARKRSTALGGTRTAV